AAGNADVAAVRGKLAAQQLDRGRLARPVLSKKRMHVSGVDLERNTVECHCRPERFAHIRQFERRHGDTHRNSSATVRAKSPAFRCQYSGMPCSAAFRPSWGSEGSKMAIELSGLGTSAGGKVLHPAFISFQVPSLHIFT